MYCINYDMVSLLFILLYLCTEILVERMAQSLRIFYIFGKKFDQFVL